MSSHIHLLCKGLESETLASIIRDFKKFTSKKIVQTIIEFPESRREWMLEYFKEACVHLKRKQQYKVWQDGYHAEHIYSNKFIKQKLNYIHQNPRINRWLSPDPARQYHSPYMSMDNRWNMSVDPTGGCIKDGVDCTPDSDGFATDGGGNLWFWDGEAFNTEFSFGLNEISLTAQTSNHARIMANPVVQAIHAGQREWKGELQALAIVMAAPVALPGLLFAGEFALPYAPQALSATRTAFTISRTGAATRFGYSASEEVFSSISQTGGLGNVNAINILGNTFMPNIGGRLLTSTIDLNYNKGFKINSFDKSIINFGVGRLNDRLH